VVADKPESRTFLHDLGWVLATCPVLQLRDPPRALTLAQQAVRLAPESADCWELLGIARYRAGDPTGAIDAGQKAMALCDGGGAEHWLYLAMAWWQEGDRAQARRWYDKGNAWVEAHRPVKVPLDLLRAEAEALVGKEQTK